MNFYEITCEQACAANVKAGNREEMLRVIAGQATKAPALDELSEDEIFEALLTREKQGSTGFGNGVAIPHARFDKAKDFVLFIVTCWHGVDFEALDKKRVKVFFVILGPSAGVRDHLRILAGISNILAHSNLYRELLNAASRSVLCELLLSKTTDEKPAHLQEKPKLLIVVLYEEAFFYELLEFYIEEGIEGATVLDSSGMGKYISNIPLFASFVSFMREDTNLSRTILATIPESRVETVIAGIEKITGDLDKQQGAMLMVLDVAFSKGSMKMM